LSLFQQHSPVALRRLLVAVRFKLTAAASSLLPLPLLAVRWRPARGA
jgi:hypothetical protein